MFDGVRPNRFLARSEHSFRYINIICNLFLTVKMKSRIPIPKQRLNNYSLQVENQQRDSTLNSSMAKIRNLRRELEKLQKLDNENRDAICTYSSNSSLQTLGNINDSDDDSEQDAYIADFIRVDEIVETLNSRADFVLEKKYI